MYKYECFSPSSGFPLYSPHNSQMDQSDVESIFILRSCQGDLSYSCAHSQKLFSRRRSHIVSSFTGKATNFWLNFIWVIMGRTDESKAPGSSFTLSWIRNASHYLLCYFIKHSEKPKYVILHKLISNDLRGQFDSFLFLKRTKLHNFSHRSHHREVWVWVLVSVGKHAFPSTFLPLWLPAHAGRVSLKSGLHSYSAEHSPGPCSRISQSSNQNKKKCTWSFAAQLLPSTSRLTTQTTGCGLVSETSLNI